uniref:SUI1 domain-containing protein n=1 Tax=Panagrellus redivivus TaxID=6233 RepID=A0A7E4W9Y6_PANRE
MTAQRHPEAIGRDWHCYGALQEVRAIQWFDSCSIGTTFGPDHPMIGTSLLTGLFVVVMRSLALSTTPGITSFELKQHKMGTPGTMELLPSAHNSNPTCVMQPEAAGYSRSVCFGIHEKRQTGHPCRMLVAGDVKAVAQALEKYLMKPLRFEELTERLRTSFAKYRRNGT